MSLLIPHFAACIGYNCSLNLPSICVSSALLTVFLYFDQDFINVFLSRSGFSRCLNKTLCSIPFLDPICTDTYLFHPLYTNFLIYLLNSIYSSMPLPNAPQQNVSLCFFKNKYSLQEKTVLPTAKICR